MSDQARHARASELFASLREREGTVRESELAALERSDPALAREVRSLLSYDEPVGDLEEGAPAGAGGTPPERIGPYRIRARIGHGSSGQVFLAEQSEPVHRRVALKLVPMAALNAEQAARFAVERAALEALDHPNVARVLDAGNTPDGLPYLVMNFVEGQPITQHCRARALPLARRLELAIQVADAVQHVHQRGLVHRDLKPANLLVAESDGRAVPQVVDFGIAKAVAGTFEGATPLTLGLPMGTPNYMAPEQTRAGPVDTRADVYGLAAVVYELVAGRPPLAPPPGTLASAADDALALLARVRHQVPEPVSRARRVALEARTPDAAPGPASRALLSDLDRVLAKALEKDPARRYATIERFAHDLRAVLESQPVAARAPSLAYRCARFVRRHRTGVAAAVLAAAGLAAGSVALALGLVEARAQQARAQDQFEAQLEVNRFLTDDLLGQAAPDLGGPDLPVRALLDLAAERIEARLAGRPLSQAAIHHALGEAYGQLADFDAGRRHLERAIELRRRSAGADAPDTLHSEIAAASLLGRSQRLAEAEPALVLAVERARRLLGPQSPALYAALNDLGVVVLSQGQAPRALELLQEALEGRARLLPGGDPKLIDSLNNVAQALDALGQSEEALARLRQALELARATPFSPRMTILGLENNVGATLQDLERDAQAEPHLVRSAELARELLGDSHPATLTIESNLASLQADLGQPERALETFRRVVEGQTAALGQDAQDTLTARHGYWSAMLKAGRAVEAAQGFETLLADVSAALGPEHALAAQSQISLARAQLGAGRPAQALPNAEAARERLEALFGGEHVRAVRARELVDAIRAALLPDGANPH
jgi:serine/threonine protein kinase